MTIFVTVTASVIKHLNYDRRFIQSKLTAKADVGNPMWKIFAFNEYHATDDQERWHYEFFIHILHFNGTSQE
jgi:hypothetical protein